MSNCDEHELLSGVNPKVIPLGDDEMDDVAGGITKGQADTAKTAANAEGRKYMLPRGNHLCAHSNKYKWAKAAKVEEAGHTLYEDIKCYKCGRTWSSYRD